MTTMTAERPVTGKAVHAQDSLGHIAVHLPGATAVFRRLKLDFCCAGHATLADATASKGLDAAALLAELNALGHHDAAPADASVAEWVDYILNRFHAVHKSELPELVRMARRVEAVHRDHPAVPRGLAEHLALMEQDLLSHMAKEEQVLFPMMLDNPGAFVPEPIRMMRMEHMDHGMNLDALLHLASDGVPPEGACNTWRALYAGILKLQDDLINHIHLENNVLFPMFDDPNASAQTHGCGGSGTCGCGH